jgi:hypothetical protein
MTAAIKPTVASQLTVAINSSVIRQASLADAMAPDNEGGHGSCQYQESPVITTGERREHPINELYAGRSHEPAKRESPALLVIAGTLPF